MSGKKGTIAIILSIVAIVLNVTTLIVISRPAEPAEVAQDEFKETQYVMYLGTNDKDTNQPVFTPEEATREAEKILIKHFGGYTIQEARGGWIDNDIEYQEFTLVIYLSDTDLDKVHAAADEMVEKFRQSSVLIHTNNTATEFYFAKDQ